MASDIDILIVSNEIPEQMSKRSEIAVKIYEAIGLEAPVELHMAIPMNANYEILIEGYTPLPRLIECRNFENG